MKHSIEPGRNISNEFSNTKECKGSILKKIALYKKEYWKRSNKIKNFYTKISKEKRDKFYKDADINILDFFYQIRLKLNYRDGDFLSSKNISKNDYYEYIKTYIEVTQKYTKVLKELLSKHINIKV